jgi:uncharacterized membrane protein
MVQGSPIAVCLRCLGIYCGVAFATLLGTGKTPAKRLLAIALLLNLLDVATASLHWHGNMPLPRFLLGFLLGVGTGAVLLSPLSRSRVRLSAGDVAGSETG